MRVLLRVHRIDPTAGKETPEGDRTHSKEDTVSPHKPPTGAYQWNETRHRGYRSTNATEEETTSVPQSWSCARIELNLLDANDNNPVFLPSNQYAFTITENAQEGDLIGTVREEGLCGSDLYVVLRSH